MAEAGTGFKRKTFIVWVLAVAVVLTLYLTNQDRIDVDWIHAMDPFCGTDPQSSATPALIS